MGRTVHSMRIISNAALALTSSFFVVIGLASSSEATPTENDELSSKSDSQVTVDFYGQQVDSEVAAHLEEYARENGLNLESEFQETPVTANPDAVQPFASNKGGIEIPPGYVYNPDLGGLHDYCTNSPDQFPAPGVNADFSGACAIHDVCYERNRGNAPAMRTCDSNFRNNLLRVCEAVYTSNLDPRRNSCRSTALVYYGAVVAFHIKNYG
ncbi:Prokaryotic phospholipase A2 [Corynebacterium diphtheriae subsp. lausannense]|nr:hypothetical protein E4653_00180 [Corynebacterium diphtheriae subsp. lausannense]SPJ40109.1 Prokaryotic phospholipase A2 [Corynebacterium diphtheriae subsp. lausannense]